MEISISNQCWTFLAAIGVGAGLSFLYDGLRFVRLLLPDSVWRVAAEDVCYCLLCGGLTMDYLLGACQGRLRGYVLLGEVLGWVLCHFTLGQLLYGLSKKLVRLLKGAAGLLFRRVLRPLGRLLGGLLRGIFRLLLRPLRFLGQIGKKLLRKYKFSLKQRAVLLYNLIKSEKRPVSRKR